jgi:hypothetical protein
MLLSYSAAFMRCNSELFPWLLCWRGTLCELIEQARKKDADPKGNLDSLDSDDEDEDEEDQRVPPRPNYAHPLRPLSERVWVQLAGILFSGKFFPRLLRGAANVGVSEGTPMAACVADVVARIHWILFDDVAISMEGSQRLVTV